MSRITKRLNVSFGLAQDKLAKKFNSGTTAGYKKVFLFTGRHCNVFLKQAQDKLLNATTGAMAEF